MHAFRVRGEPKPQGSTVARTDGNGRAFVVRVNSKELTEWRRAVAFAAREAVGYGAVIDQPVAVSITFWLPRPKSRPKRDVFPDRKPDLDKLVRAVLDALGTDAAVIKDDSRVVRLNVTKLYATDDVPPGAYITVNPL